MSESVDAFRELFRYDRWANLRVVEKLEALPEDASAEEPIRLYSHVLRSGDVWLARIRGEPAPTEALWRSHERGRLRAETERIADEWETLLAGRSEGDLDAAIVYRNSSGTEYRNSLRAILRHVANHGTYHRGQIAMRLSERTGDPPVTDYIARVREQDR